MRAVDESLSPGKLYQLAPGSALFPSSDAQGNTTFVLTRAMSRSGPMELNEAFGRMALAFDQPKSIEDAILELSEATGESPQDCLREAFPAIKLLFRRGILIDATEPESSVAWLADLEASLIGYQILQRIRVLEDSACLRVRNLDGNFIIKAGNPDNRFVRATLRHEAAMLKQEGMSHLHDCVPQLFCDASDQAVPHIIIRQMPGLALSAHNTSQLPLARRMDVAASVAAAYARLHAIGVLHVDVHSGNVLVEGSQISIVDFGTARSTVIDNPMPGRAVAPTAYEPEAAMALLAGKPVPLPTFAGEQYCVAALCYEIITGKPYIDFPQERNALYGAIANRNPIPFEAAELSAPNCEAVLTRALAKRPEDRFPSTEDFLSALKAAIKIDRQTDPVAQWLVAVATPYRAEVGLPIASVNFGSAGTGAALLQIAAAWSDSQLLAAGERWLAHAWQEAANPSAYLEPDKGLSSAVVSECSVLHGVNGTLLTAWLNARLWGDDQRAEHFLRQVKLPAAGRFNHDLFLGDLGIFAALSLFRRQDLSTQQTDWLDSNASRMLSQAIAPDDVSGSGRLGLAHGLAGRVWALAFYARSGTGFDRRRFAELCDLLVQCGQRDGNGRMRWRWGTDRAGRDYYMPGLCSGDAGFAIVWNEVAASNLYPAAEALADDCAALTADAQWSSGHICCGSAGGSAALLALYRRTGNQNRLAQARALAEQSLTSKFDAPQLSLMKGFAGAVCMHALCNCNDVNAKVLPFACMPS